MFLKLRGKDKLFGTAIGTRIGDSFVYRALVNETIASQSEPFLTMPAFVFFFARVQRLVFLQGLLASE